MSPRTKKIKHGSVRITADLINSMKLFLETEEAQAMAYNSMSDIASEAIKRMLTDFGFFPFKVFKPIVCVRCGHINKNETMLCENCDTPLKGMRRKEFR